MRILALPDNGPAEIYADALSVFATLLRRDLATLKSARDWPAELRLPLFARARALLAVEAAETDGLTADNILNQLIDREEVLWRREMHGDGSNNSPAIRSDLDLVRQALTLLTLSSPTSVCDADTLLCRLPRLASHSIETRERFLKALHPLYGDGDLLRGLEPDLLGEHLVWRTVKSPTDPLLIAATGNEASEAQAQTALTILNRLAARKPDAVAWLRVLLDRAFNRLAVPAFRVALEQPLPMAALFRGVMSRLSFDQALALAPLLPEHTTELREIAATVEQRLVAAPLPANAPTAALGFRASHLNNLSLRLSSLGQRERALAAGEEAVGLNRTLAKTLPDAFLPNLAMSLNNLTSCLSDLGQREQALAAGEEAVAIRRTLAETRPDAFLPNLASALNNLSICLSNLGQRERALAAVEEAVGLYRTLAETRPDSFLPNLATALNTMSIRLSDLGQQERALSMVMEAVDLYRALAETRPDAFRPNLATVLITLSNRLSGLGQRERALAAVEEAVGLYRTLAETRPNAFLPDLASALNNLSNRLSNLGQWEKALAAVEEAVAIRRTLVETRPDVFLPDLASSLGNLSNRLSDLGQREMALAAVEEAVGLYRTLAEIWPDAFLPNLAKSVSVLRDRLRDANLSDDALAAAQEAASMLFPYFRRLPAAFGDRMLLFFLDYIESAQEAGQEPDPALVDPIRAALIEHGFLPPPDAEPNAPSPT